MSLPRLIFIALLTTGALAESANACTDSRNMQSYFSYQRPERHGDTIMLRVRVSIASDDRIIAKLDGPFSRLSSDGNVQIELPALPMGSTCLLMGPVDGPVWVMGTLIRNGSGGLTLEALSTRYRPAPTGHFARVHSDEEIDQYIVDPAYLTPAERRRRGSLPHD